MSGDHRQVIFDFLEFIRLDNSDDSRIAYLLWEGSEYTIGSYGITFADVFGVTNIWEVLCEHVLTNGGLVFKTVHSLLNVSLNHILHTLHL